MPIILKYLIVYSLSGFKIIFGPTLGAAYGFSIVETALLSLGGMMTTVYILSYFGNNIRSFTHRILNRKSKPKNFTPKRRKFVRIWKKWGIPGIAFLTPLFLSPIGGALLVNAFGGKRRDIFKWMWIFGGIWSIILTLLVKYASEQLVHLGIM